MSAHSYTTNAQERTMIEQQETLFALEEFVLDKPIDFLSKPVKSIKTEKQEIEMEIPFPEKENRSVRTKNRFKYWAKFWTHKNYFRLQTNIDFKFEIDLHNLDKQLLCGIDTYAWKNSPDRVIIEVIGRIKHFRKWLYSCELWREHKKINPESDITPPEYESNFYYWKCNEFII